MNDTFDALVAWVRARGGFVGALRAEDRRITAGKDLADGDVVLRLPLAACVNQDAVRATRIGARLPPEWNGGPALAAASFELRTHPTWSPYFATVPTWVRGHPNTLPPDSIAGTSVAEMLPEIQALHRAEWEWLRQELDIAEEQWRDARTLVTSRQFDVGTTTALVPIADLLDHAAEPEVEWSVADGWFTMRACRDVPAGTTLHDTYGHKSNARLLLHYGFALPDNPYDEVLVDFGRAGFVTLAYAADNPGIAAARMVLGPGRVLEFLVRRRDALPKHTTGYVRHLADGERAVLDAWIVRCNAPG